MHISINNIHEHGHTLTYTYTYTHRAHWTDTKVVFTCCNTTTTIDLRQPTTGEKTWFYRCRQNEHCVCQLGNPYSRVAVCGWLKSSSWTSQGHADTRGCRWVQCIWWSQGSCENQWRLAQSSRPFVLPQSERGQTRCNDSLRKHDSHKGVVSLDR